MGLDIYSYQDPSPLGHRFYQEKRQSIRFDNLNRNAISFIQSNNVEPLKSTLYPDHLCTPDYLRSSYNDAGYNNVCRLYGLMDLYEIFDPILINNDCDTDCSKDKLERCLINAKKNQELWHKLDKMQFSLLECNGRLRNENAILTTKSAIEKIKSKYKDGSYNNDLYLEGIETFPKPLEVYGFIPKCSPYFGEGLEDLSAQFSHSYLIYKSNIEWYIQMSDIIVEFIEHALSIEDPYILFWG